MTNSKEIAATICYALLDKFGSEIDIDDLLNGLTQYIVAAWASMRGEPNPNYELFDKWVESVRSNLINPN